MATILEKDVTRESTSTADDREIMVTLTSKQKISMKLKGKRTGAVEIGIDELYGQLTGNPIDGEVKERKSVSIIHSNSKPTKKNPMILLNDLRSQSAIADLDYNMKAKFDGIIKNLINLTK